MKIILYSTGCPKCSVLKAKLDKANIEYEVINDMKIMLDKGFMAAPKLEVIDGDTTKVFDFAPAINYIRELGK